MRIQINQVRVDHSDDETVTVFPDGSFVVADHTQQDGQEATARALGMTVGEMNRTHDLTHSLLALWLGMPHSPTLYGVALGRAYEHHALEEQAVLAIQAFAAAVGVDLVERAK